MQNQNNQMEQMKQINTEMKTEEEFDLTGFIEYIFKDGLREQKRELISCLNTKLYLENRIVTTKEQKG